ncbi:hypothetical protein [Dysgonomonas sp.]
MNCKSPLRKRDKIGDSQIITISDNGTISGQGETKMRIGEMAGLFGIYYRTAKRHIRTLYFEKAGVACGDYTMSCSADGSGIYPDYSGSDLIATATLRIGNPNTGILRIWIIGHLLRPGLTVLNIPIHKQGYEWI